MLYRLLESILPQQDGNPWPMIMAFVLCLTGIFTHVQHVLHLLLTRNRISLVPWTNRVSLLILPFFATFVVCFLGEICAMLPMKDGYKACLGATIYLLAYLSAMVTSVWLQLRLPQKVEGEVK